MSLSNSFTEDYKRQFAERNVKIGTVIRVHVRDTKPPKEKRIILVGVSYDKLFFATVFINSDINPNVFPTKELRDLNLPLTAVGREYLDHDSFADCSELVKRNAGWLLDLLADDPGKVIGEVSKEDLVEIFEKIKGAKTISPGTKKMFGLFL